MSFQEVEGNLFNFDFPALAHGCNCCGVMGAGIALEFRRRWPEMFKEYVEFCEDGGAMPGDYYPYATEDGLLIFNLLTQPVPGPTATLDHIRSSLTKAIEHAMELNVRTIGMPRIGSGLGGLKWGAVKDVLQELCVLYTGFNLVVVTLPQDGSTPHPDVAHLSQFKHPMFKVKNWEASSVSGKMVANVTEPTKQPDEADLIVSAISGTSPVVHTVMLDLDVPAVLVPSSTPGHSHLYIDVPVTWDIYQSLLDAMVKAKILEPGYVAVSKRRGGTALRLPWVKKVTPK